MARHRARQQALQMLFQWDVRRTAPEEIVGGYYGSLLVTEEDLHPPIHDPFAEELFRGVMNACESIDERITKHAAHWKISRMPVVDRNILRIAVHEMMTTDTPPPVIIDEALELARRFSAEESVQFVNGVLDAVRRDLIVPAPPVAPPD
ncbi:MAG: NusB antitermination factor [Bryobacterales bacterium]|jgi:N utilization substance protein B|nr:NusB antitermination factor [Bryobacterales bacterium]